MIKKTWKNIERKVAAWFGTERTPLSGGNSKMTRSDTLHRHLFIEVKYRKQMTICELFKDTAILAKREGKIPVVVAQQKYDDPLVVCRIQDLQIIAGYIDTKTKLLDGKP